MLVNRQIQVTEARRFADIDGQWEAVNAGL
jgi:hypothetical protein